MLAAQLKQQSVMMAMDADAAHDDDAPAPADEAAETEFSLESFREELESLTRSLETGEASNLEDFLLADQQQQQQQPSAEGGGAPPVPRYSLPSPLRKKEGKQRSKTTTSRTRTAAATTMRERQQQRDEAAAASYNYQTPDTSFLSNSSKAAAATPGPPPPVETPARTTLAPPTPEVYCVAADVSGAAAERGAGGTDDRARPRSSKVQPQGTSSSTAGARSSADANDWEHLFVEREEQEEVDDDDDDDRADAASTRSHRAAGEQNDKDDEPDWKRVVERMAETLHRQEERIRVLELENARLRAGARMERRRRRRFRGGDDDYDDVVGDLENDPDFYYDYNSNSNNHRQQEVPFSSPGTRFVAELASVMNLPEEHYGPLSRIMDKYYNQFSEHPRR